MPKLNYVITDMFTGQDREIPDLITPGEPTQYWINGWNAYHDDQEPEDNPYSEHTFEWREWLDGYEAAEAD